MSVQPVVVGVDGSPDSANALRWAAEYGRRFEAPVHAVTLWEIPQASGYPAMFGESEIAELESQARSMLDETIARTLGEDSQVSAQVRQGHPARALIAASESAQLLVVGSRGHGAFVGMLIGSVSQHCVQHAHCPVVVMHTDAEDN